MRMKWLRVISAGSVSTAAVTTALALVFSTGTVANAKPRRFIPTPSPTVGGLIDGNLRYTFFCDNEIAFSTSRGRADRVFARIVLRSR